MRVINESTGEVLASDIEVADSVYAKFRGLRFRQSFEEGQAVVFPFDAAGTRAVDMVFVPFPIDVLWLYQEDVRRVGTLRPWIGFGIAQADTVIELPALQAANVEAGDRVIVER